MVKLFSEQAWFLIGLKYFNFIRIKMSIVKIQLIKNQNPKNFSFKLQEEQWHCYKRPSENKPGTAQVGAISKAQKDSKTTFSTTGDNKSSQKTKNWEKKFVNFFLNFFLKFPLSRIVPKM